MSMQIPIHDVDIRLLRIFKVITECRGFAAAEERLRVSRSTISKHISALEERLQMRLCERGPSGFSLTPNGQAVYDVTIRVLDSLDEFSAQVAKVRGQLSGSVSLWIMDYPHSVGKNMIANILHEFRKRPGRVHLEMNAAPPDLVEDAVAAGHAHVGISVSYDHRTALVYMPLATQTAFLYCAKSYKRLRELTNKKLTRETLISHDFVTRNYLWQNSALMLQAQTSTATVGHIEATLQCILSGEHIGVMPEHIGQPWVERGVLVRLHCRELETARQIYAIHRTGAEQNPTVKALLEDIKTHYHDDGHEPEQDKRKKRPPKL